MTHIPQIHQLVVRRRRDGQSSFYPEGYDEFVGQTPTGKIVLGWKIIDGVIVYEYAPMTKDEADARPETPCELPIPNWKIRREVVFTTEMDAGIVMTKEEKLRVHLEEIIFEDLPEGTPLTSAEVMARCAAATAEQHERAYARALVRSPLLLEDER